MSETTAPASRVLAVTLVYRNSLENANKFWNLVLFDSHVVVGYGRIGASPQFTHHAARTPDLAAKKAFALLREKAGRGYVITSATPGLEIPNAALLNGTVLGWYSSTRDLFTQVIQSARHNLVREIPAIAGLVGRTPSRGYTLLLDLVNPDLEPETLIDMCLAPEPFLRALALNHSRCPDEAKVAAALLAACA